jgi:hypothetical protein
MISGILINDIKTAIKEFADNNMYDMYVAIGLKSKVISILSDNLINPKYEYDVDADIEFSPTPILEVSIKERMTGETNKIRFHFRTYGHLHNK